MELRFLTPDLESLDHSGHELLVVNLFTDRRPAQGVAGLVDWRSAGRISRLVQTGFVSGELGEVLLVPGKPFLPFDKILLIGSGQVDQLDEGVFCGLVERILRTVEGLCIRSVVIELPGRQYDQIEAERSAELLLNAAQDNTAHDVWTLLEAPAEQQRIAARRLQQQRRHPDDIR